MHLDELKKLVKLEEDSQGFPSIHDAVVAYIFALTVSGFQAPLFWSESDKQNLPVPSDSVIRAGKEVGKVEAVKLYKKQTGHALLTSKRAVEDYFEGKGLGFKKWTAYP